MVQWLFSIEVSQEIVLHKLTRSVNVNVAKIMQHHHLQIPQLKTENFLNQMIVLGIVSATKKICVELKQRVRHVEKLQKSVGNFMERLNMEQKYSSKAPKGSRVIRLKGNIHILKHLLLSHIGVDQSEQEHGGVQKAVF